MVEMTGVYLGGLRCELTHGPSGTKINTDAPKDNQGKGEAFSPTDMLGAALGSCILTTLAIVAERDGLDVRKSHFRVTKEMNPNPRKISVLKLDLYLPKQIPTEKRSKLEHIAMTCPVHRSLSPEIEMPIHFIWEIE